MSYGTAYYNLEGEASVFEMAFRALAEGNFLRGTARIVSIDAQTCRAWLERYAHQCRLGMLSLWQNLHIEECQLDELWSFVHTKEANLATAKLIYSDLWRCLGMGCLCFCVANGSSICGG